MPSVDGYFFECFERFSIFLKNQLQNGKFIFIFEKIDEENNAGNADY
jgi:hypothetical protein